MNSVLMAVRFYNIGHVPTECVELVIHSLECHAARRGKSQPHEGTQTWPLQQHTSTVCLIYNISGNGVTDTCKDFLNQVYLAPLHKWMDYGLRTWYFFLRAVMNRSANQWRAHSFVVSSFSSGMRPIEFAWGRHNTLYSILALEWNS